MSLAEMIPTVYALPREEKLRLYQLLAQDLGDEAPPDPRLPPGLRGEVWSTITDETTAAKLLEYMRLREEKP